jgi:hypothetical protein
MIATPRNPPPTAAVLLLEAIDLPRPASPGRPRVGGGFLFWVGLSLLVGLVTLLA